MKKFNIEVQWHYTAIETSAVEVEASSMEEAKAKALEIATECDTLNTLEWSEGEVVDGEYVVGTECVEMTEMTVDEAMGILTDRAVTRNINGYWSVPVWDGLVCERRVFDDAICAAEFLLENDHA